MSLYKEGEIISNGHRMLRAGGTGAQKSHGIWVPPQPGRVFKK